jgi:predicted transcriptional regulator
MMNQVNVISARVADDVLAGLDKLVQDYDRSRAWLVARAVKSYIEEETAFQAAMDEAELAIDNGDFYTQEEMEAWASGLRQRDKVA